MLIVLAVMAASPTYDEWMTEMLVNTNILQFVFWVILIGALITALVKGWPVISGIVEGVNAVVDLPEEQRRTRNTLDRIERGTKATFDRLVLVENKVNKYHPEGE